MQSYQDWGGPVDFKTILEQISSDDIMFVYEGVTSLKNALSVCEESSLSRFPHEKFCQKLIAVLKQPVIMEEISNEIKLMTIQSLTSIIDIYPTHLTYLLQLGLVAALKETMESSMGYMDLVEGCIKFFEKISSQNPREILRQGVVTMAISMLDFFDKNTQSKIIQLFVNVSGAAQTDDDFTKNILPNVPFICQMLTQKFQSETYRLNMEKIALVLYKVCCSLPNIAINSANRFDSISSLYEQLSDQGIHEIILDILQEHSNLVKLNSDQSFGNISTESKYNYTQSCISNFLQVLQYSCMYSQQVVMQLTSASIFDILEPLMPNQNDPLSTLNDVLNLIESILPDSDNSLLSETLDCNDASYIESQKKYQNEKKQYFFTQDAQLYSQILKKILPKIFSAFNTQINNDFRTKCLSLISKILLVIPKALFSENFDAATFTKFIHMILIQKQPEQVLCCLQTALHLLDSEYGELFQQNFIRNGICQAIQDLTESETIQDLNQFQPVIKPTQPKQLENSDLNSQLQLMVSERERTCQRINSMQSLVDALQNSKKEEMLRVIKKYQEMQDHLDQKIKELQQFTGLDMKQLQNQKSQIQVQSKILYGTKIAEIANSIKSKYTGQNIQNSEEYSMLIKLATELRDQVENFDIENSQNVFSKLANVLVADQGITSFEFSSSGLLSSIKCIFTSVKSEEQKSQEGVILSRKEATQYLLRLKIFVDLMCNKINDKLPFKQLLNLCHEQLTLQEPIIFKDFNLDSNQNQPFTSINRGVIVNLIYDGDDEQFGSLQTIQKSELNLKRHFIFKLLNQIPLNIQKTDTTQILEDFLLKRVRTNDDVKALHQQSQQSFNQQKKKEGQTASDLQIKPELLSLYNKLMDRIEEFVDECPDVEFYNELKPVVVLEIASQIFNWEKEKHQIVEESFYKYLSENTHQLIKELAQQEQEDVDGMDIPEEELELVSEQLQYKTEAFLQLLDEIQKYVKESHNQDQADQLKLSGSSSEISDVPTDPIPSIISTQEFKHPSFLPTIAEPSFSVEQLLKQANNQDVEILFYYNKKLIEPKISFYEVFKDEPDTVPDNQNLGKLQDIMFQLSGGQYDCRTVYFKIRDKQPQAKEVIQPQMEKSVLVETEQRVENFVQSLIEQFQIKSFESNLEHSLVILKVLWFLWSNSFVFMNKALSLYVDEQALLSQNDFSLASFTNEINIELFNHSRIDSSLKKTLQQPYSLISASVGKMLKVIFRECSFLFSFETKTLYFRLISILSVDSLRAQKFLLQHFEKIGKPKQLRQFTNQKQPEKQKLKIDRKISIVNQALAHAKQIKKKSLLEIVFLNEEGTGLGPTLEFYNLLGLELRSDKTMWRAGQSGLYPKCLSVQNQEDVKKICDKFQLMGVFIAKSILDDRLIDLPISEQMWDIVFKKKSNIFDLKKLDPAMFAILQDLQLMANRRQLISEMQDIDSDTRHQLFTQIRTAKGASIEDYDLRFYNPSDDRIELIKNGHNIKVTLDNLQSYIDLVLDSTFNHSVNLQIKSFVQGFNSVMPIELLSDFRQANELENLICGDFCLNAHSQQWTDTSQLSELISTAHGYNQNSTPFQFFLRYLTELDPINRSTFVQFITGSPRLPVGGFKALEPRLTVVLKKPENQKVKSDDILPSVMTCQNYLKMPAYSSYETLKSKFDIAIREGADHFGLA